MEELGFMRDKSTFNKPHNHAYSLETSKLMALMHATELPVVSKNLVPSDITVKGDKKCKINCIQSCKACWSEITLRRCISASGALFSALIVLRFPPPHPKALLEASVVQVMENEFIHISIFSLFKTKPSYFL